MTIKTRNRINISLFIISLLILIVDISIIIFKIWTKSYFPKAYINQTGNSFFLTRYNTHCIIASLLFELIYISITSSAIYRGFQKTQSSEVIYFSLFLFAVLFDSARLIIILFNIEDTYSMLLLACGNSCLFSRVLYPIALLFTVILSKPEQRQNLEKNLFLTMLGSLFLTQYIPLNTTVTNSNYCVDFAYGKIMTFVGIFSLVIGTIALFANNRQHLFKQTTTLGFILISVGVAVLFISTNLLLLLLAIILLSVGTPLYLYELHRQYLLY